TEYIKIGGSQYDDTYFKYLNNVVQYLGNETKNINFAPTSNTARKIALKLSEKIVLKNDSAKIHSLIKYISNTIHKNYDLNQVLRKSIIYHHGKMPIHIRNVFGICRTRKK
ncbi:hypothetical protein, partial [Capnocytophaga canimorsus]|uniref:hypothetical protein n=1 Tax=Capnocytophaga canimorsus TaxID=28188 RepID=UPI001559AEDC